MPRAGPVLERVRRAVAHDIGTPLSTIANYAAVLESSGKMKPGDVRDFAGRIRGIAVRTSVMLRQMVDAMILSERVSPGPEVDPSSLVRTLLSEMTLHVRFPARGREISERIPFDRELLAYAWRAFLTVNAEAAASRTLDVDLELQRTAEHIAIEMSIGSPEPLAQRQAAGAGASNFYDVCAEVIPRDSCFALELAEELVLRRGGQFDVWGRPEMGAGLRIGFPRKPA